VHTYNSRYSEDRKKRIKAGGQPEQEYETLYANILKTEN
jgi:hypothetical protein